MLYFSPTKVAAILIIAPLGCLSAVPNFFPESVVRSWPSLLQRRIVLGLDLQGGSHILFEVDTDEVRKDKVASLLDDVRRALLKQPRIGYTGLTARGNSVEVKIRDSVDFQ